MPETWSKDEVVCWFFKGFRYTGQIYRLDKTHAVMTDGLCVPLKELIKVKAAQS